MAGSSYIRKDIFGTTKDGHEVDKYTLQNKNKVSVEIITYGGIITSVHAPDRDGNIADITTGFDTLSEYENGNVAYFGALIGRVANRIAKGKFELDGKSYQMVINNGPNHIHGGTKGFDKVVWKATVDGSSLTLMYISPDGEEKYPGEVTTVVKYELNDDNELLIDYTATSTKPTPVNLTNHAYFNLAGHGAGLIHDHEVTIHSDKYTPKGELSTPTGEIADVAGTVFDLRQPIVLGDRINNVAPEDRGYDHNFCLSAQEDGKTFAAKVEHKGSGRVLEVYTNQPGIQLYTGNFLDGIKGKGGAVYNKHGAFALETQNYPDAINLPNFPSCVLKPGSTYRHTTWYKFTTSA